MKRALVLLGIAGLLVAVGAVLIPGYLSTDRGPTEPSPSRLLKALASAEADFRANNRDGSGKRAFWRADVTGLYTLEPPGRPAIKLIDLYLAAADDRPQGEALSKYAVRAARSGCWFRAIRHADEDPARLDPNRFAFCAFPDYPAANKYMFIVDESNRIFRAPALGRRGIEVYPTQAQLEKEWTRVD